MRYADFKPHGMTKTGVYKSWLLMHKRCRNKNNPHYGGRGVSVCDRWQNFLAFFEDMGNRPCGMTLDRIKTDEPYSKDNCRWASGITQSNNKRNNFMIQIDGTTKSASEWSRISGINKHTIIFRIRHGEGPKQAVFRQPAKPGNDRRINKITK